MFHVHLHRVAKENRIFAGLWYGSAKPDMSLFLKPVAMSLKRLYFEGIYSFTSIQPMIDSIYCFIGIVLSLSNGESVCCRIALLVTSVDLPARAAINNFIQFNGYWGCCICLQKG